MRILTPYVVLIVTATAAADDKPPFKITTKRETDRVSVKVEKDRAVVAIEDSPYSQAVIERNGEKWPEVVILRLHLSGLERIAVWNEDATLVGRAGAAKDSDRVQFGKAGKEGSTSIGPDHPFWMDVRGVGRDGKTSEELPLKGGYFEVRLPRALFEKNPKSITVDWVDWFRG